MTGMTRDPKQRLKKFFSRDAQAISGLSGIEFALIAPVLILMFLVTVDFGLAAYAKIEVEAATQAGAEYAALYGYDSTKISSAVTNATAVSGLSATPAPSEFCGCPSSSGVTTATCGTNCDSGMKAGTFVTVSAQASYSTLLSYPSIVPSSYTFSSAATVRLQ